MLIKLLKARSCMLVTALSMSFVGFCNDGLAMIVPDALDAAVQKKTRGLKEFAQSSIVEIAGDGMSWIQIPSWLAGTWCSAETVALTSHDRTPDKRKFDVDLKLIAYRKIGTLRDAQGHIWHCLNHPAVKTETGGIVETNTIKRCEIVYVDSKTIEIRTDFLVQESESQTGLNLGTFVEKTVVRQELISQGRLKTTVSASEYDENGALLDAFSRSCVESKIKPFQAAPSLKEQQSFERFFKHSKQMDLDY